MSKKSKAAKKASPPKVASAPKAGKYDHIVNIPFRKCVIAAKGFTNLANDLEVSRQAISKWEVVPERFAVKCEELYGVPRELIAPELYKGMVRKSKPSPRPSSPG